MAVLAAPLAKLSRPTAVASELDAVASTPTAVACGWLAVALSPQRQVPAVGSLRHLTSTSCALTGVASNANGPASTVALPLGRSRMVIPRSRRPCVQRAAD